MPTFTLSGAEFSAPEKIQGGKRDRVFQEAIKVARKIYGESSKADAALFGSLDSGTDILVWAFGEEPYTMLLKMFEAILTPVTSMTVADGYENCTEEEKSAVVNFIGPVFGLKTNAEPSKTGASNDTAEPQTQGQ